MGYNPADSLARRSRRERQEENLQEKQNGLPSASAIEAERRALGRRVTPASGQSEYQTSGLIRTNRSEVRTAGGEVVAAARRTTLGPIELSESIRSQNGTEFQVLGIPFYKRGGSDPLAQEVHKQVNRNIRMAESAKDANVERGAASRSAPADRRQQTATAQPSHEAIVANRKALLASTGKEHPTNQDIYNALRRHYGSDSATYRNAERDFGINAGALVKDQSTRRAIFGQTAGHSAGRTQESAPPRAIPVPEHKQEHIPRAIPVPEPKPTQQATPQQVINSYYHGAGVTRAERNSAAGFNKAQAYATKLGPEHRAAFDAAVAARRSNN